MSTGEGSAVQGTSSPAFITHSTCDRELAERLVRALRLGTGLPANKVFCSSIEGYDIDVGKDFVQYLRDELQNTPLLLPLITPAYQDSKYCQWELGAAWVREVDICPILVEPVKPEELQGPLQNRQVARLTKAGLNKLVEQVSRCFNVPIDRDLWETERDSLLADLSEILVRLRGEWAGTDMAIQRRHAMLAHQVHTLHMVFHRLRDAASLNLLNRSSDMNHFLYVLRSASDEIADCFSGMTGHACRVSVKQVLDKGGGVPAVVDLSRSGTIPLRRTLDLIEHNSDFEELMVGTSPYFLCNNIAKLRSTGNYKNSHIVDGQALPYNSTVVWPVRKTLDQPPVGDSPKIEAVSDWQDIIAYLCVDSPETDVFSEEHIWVGAAIADGMWSVLRPWFSID